MGNVFASPISIRVETGTMARTGKLSAVEVTKAKGPAVLHDGSGLYLRASATGARLDAKVARRQAQRVSGRRGWRF